MFDKKVFGEKVSAYGLENGYLDYRTLARIVGDCILNNNLRDCTEFHDWELLNGEDVYGIDEDGRKCDLYSDDCVDEIYPDIYQDYIISERGYDILSRYTDEIVYYNEQLDIYIWAITHYGTSWDYVLTDLKLIDGDVKYNG